MQYHKCVSLVFAWRGHIMNASVFHLAFPGLSSFSFPCRVCKVPTFTHVLSFVFEIHCIGKARNLRKHYADFEITCSLPWSIFRGICLKAQASPFLDKAEVLPFVRLEFQECSYQGTEAQLSREAGRWVHIGGQRQFFWNLCCQLMCSEGFNVKAGDEIRSW